MSTTEPTLSVIVPARNAAHVLERSLTAVLESDLTRADFELIVVDDGSRDDSPAIAAAHADRVAGLNGGPRGPAYARNRGAELARGRLLAFVDADVCVHPGTLRGFVERLAAAPDLGAVFGAYDTAPPARGLVSQYRNLVHHWVHARHAGDAQTFWAGCGAVRAEAFRQVGGFDAERFPRPQVEDIDLGHRLRDAGWRILLDPTLQGTHLKRWTLRDGLLTDVRDRGIPWALLVLANGGRERSSALNLHRVEKLATVLAWLAVPAAVVGLATRDVRWAVVVVVLLVLALLPSLGLFRWLARLRGPLFALRAVPLRLLYYFANGISVAVAGWRVVRGGWRTTGRPKTPELRA